MSEETETANIFEKENTVSQSGAGIQRLLVLQNKYVLFNRWLFYLDQVDGSGVKETAKRRLKSITKILFEDLRPRMKGRKDYKIEEIEKQIKDDPEKAIRRIVEYLELDLRLTKIDTMKDFDRTDTELENTEKGL